MREGLHAVVALCVDLSVCVDEITFHICLWRTAIVPTENIEAFWCVDFAKNLRIESYSEKYLSRRLCGDRADGRVDIEHTNSYN